MKLQLQSFGKEFTPPATPLLRFDYPNLAIRLAIPADWTQLAPFAFQSPDKSALLVFSTLQLRGPMDAHAAAAFFAESSGLQPLAYRQLGSRDDAETLCRKPASRTKLTLLRVVQIGASTWAIRAHWDAGAPTSVDMATLRTSIRSFHGEAAPAPAAPRSIVSLAWKNAVVPVACPAGWKLQRPGEDRSIRLRPVIGSDAYLCAHSLPPVATRAAVFTLWRSELERAGYQVFGAPILREPNSPTSTVLLKAEKDGRLFDAPAALSELAEGSLLLSFLAPTWMSAPETAAITHRAFADFALAIEDALRTA
ncbi:MAG: hypothetical protein ACKV2U_28405 [Bryobacteraceae bacterium]